MRLSDIQVGQDGDAYQLQAQVLSNSDQVDNFLVWYRFPSLVREVSQS